MTPPTQITTFPRISHEYIHVEKDLGCVPQSRNFSFDNWSRLQPVFRYDVRNPRSIFFPGERYRINSTLETTFKHGLSIIGVGGSGIPLSESHFLASEVSIYEHGGPISAITWGGSAGGTMLRINGGGGFMSGMSLYGQAHATNGAVLVEPDINYNLSAGVGILLNDGDELDLGESPPTLNPGVWNFHNLTLNCLPVGMQIGVNSTTGEHADHCCFTGIFRPNWCQKAIQIKGAQSVQFHFDMIVPLDIERMFDVYAGGQVHVSSGRVQGVHLDGAYPTWLYINGAEVNHGKYIFDSLHADGTLTNGYRLVDCSDSQVGGSLLTSVIFNGFSTDLHSYPDPIMRLRGPVHVVMNRAFGLEEGSFQFHSVNVADWGGAGATTLRPSLTLNDCIWADGVSPPSPANGVNGSSTGQRLYRWFNNFTYAGRILADGSSDVTS